MTKLTKIAPTSGAVHNYVDVHTHLEMSEFDSDRDAAIQRARDAGLAFICTVGTDPKYWRTAVAIAEKNDFIYLSLGLHPHEAAEYTDTLEEQLISLLAHPKCLAVGEIGLDFFKNYSPRDIQKQVFEKQLNIAERLGKPVMIHIRDAHAEAQEILGKWNGRGIIHCFSGTVDDALFYVKRGFYISVPGFVTFKKAVNIHDVVRSIPLDAIVTETDAPFIAPEPYRGKRNEPSFIPYTLAAIAKLKGVTVEDAARTIAVNARKAFNMPVEEKTRLSYAIRNSLYLNLTNRCTNQCTFCGKNSDLFVKGHYLGLDREPSLDDLIASLPADITLFDEIVFCGYGEPTIRFELIMQLGKMLKNKRARKLRLNTDGLASLRENRNVVPELAKVIDSVSISLNAADEETYVKICRPELPGSFSALLDFISQAKQNIREVTATAVGLPNLDMNKIKNFVEKELQVAFRERQYDDLG